MKTYIAYIQFYQGSVDTVNVLMNQLAGVPTVTAHDLTSNPHYLVTLAGAFPDGNVLARITPMAAEVEAGPQQYLSVSRWNDDKVMFSFGNGEVPQHPNAGPYFLEIHVKDAQ